MKTIKEIATSLGVKRSTLSVKLWDCSISPTKYETRSIEGHKRLVGVYDRAAEASIRAMIKKKPIRNYPGRPRKPTQEEQ